MLLAYHNDETIKRLYLDRLSEHATAHEIVQGRGYYWDPKKTGKGCALGCTVHANTNVYALYESELGIASFCAKLKSRIFEGMSQARAVAFACQFLEAIPVGANLQPEAIWLKLAPWLLTESPFALVASADTSALRQEIESVSSIYAHGSWHDGELQALGTFIATGNYSACRAEQAVRCMAYALKYKEHALEWALNAVDFATLSAFKSQKPAYDAVADKLLELLAQS
jgi:hypothetical protein